MFSWPQAVAQLVYTHALIWMETHWLWCTSGLHLVYFQGYNQHSCDSLHPYILNSGLKKLEKRTQEQFAYTNPSELVRLILVWL